MHVQESVCVCVHERVCVSMCVCELAKVNELSDVLLSRLGQNKTTKQISPQKVYIALLISWNMWQWLWPV